MEAYFIYQLYQTGNVGSHNIERIKDQPKGGFSTFKKAEAYLSNAMKNKNQWIFQQSEYKFTILKVYQP